MMGGVLYYADILVIVAYFVFVLTVGLYTSIRAQRNTVGGYFLAGRSLHWLVVGASIFGSNIGSVHFVGLAGSGAATGYGVANYEFLAVFLLIYFAWVCLPVYLASAVSTVPEYFSKRFGGQRIRMMLAIISLLMNLVARITGDLFAGSIFIKQSFDLDVYTAVGLLILVAVTFTAIGGLTAVVWTDFVQVVIILFGSSVLFVMSLMEVGGWSGLREKYPEARPSANFTVPNSTCGEPNPEAFHLFRDASDTHYPWTGMIFGLQASSMWHWCADQVMVQRSVAAKSYYNGQMGNILCAFLKFVPFFLMVIPGMIARVLYPDEVACSTPESCFEICGSPQGCSNIAYPLLVVRLMPIGLKGLMLSVMLSSLMSSLSSIFNSASAVFTIDIWGTLRRKASTLELLIVGRLFILLLMALSIACVSLVNIFPGSELFHYLNAMLCYLTPPVAGIYTMALFCPRVTEQGAFWGLVIGVVMGIIRFAVEFSYHAPFCGEVDLRPLIITKVHYLHFGGLSFIVTAMVCGLISLASTGPDPDKLVNMLYDRYSSPVSSLENGADHANGVTASAKLKIAGDNRGSYAQVSPAVDQSVKPAPEKRSRVLRIARSTGKLFMQIVLGTSGKDDPTTSSPVLAQGVEALAKTHFENVTVKGATIVLFILAVCFEIYLR